MKLRARVQLFFDDVKPLVQQHFKSECDINNIMKKYSASQILEHNRMFQGNYGDFTNVQDYRSSLDQVIRAQDMFMSLPADIRKRFSNDPAEFLSFVDDEKNIPEMKTLGLISSIPVSDKQGDQVADK